MKRPEQIDNLHALYYVYRMYMYMLCLNCAVGNFLVFSDNILCISERQTISKDRVNPCYVKLHSVVCHVVNVFTVFS